MAYASVLTLTEEQRDALGIALDENHDERLSYLVIGNPSTDHGDEWPEVAATKADICERLGEIEQQLFGTADAGECRWTALAKGYRKSGAESVEAATGELPSSSMFKLAVVAHEDMVNDDAINTTAPCEVIKAKTSADAWVEFNARFGTNDYSAYEVK